MRTSGVYVITNRVNGKRYVGSSCDVRQRASSHLSNLRHGRHGNPHLQAAWAKYGEPAFEFKMVESCKSPEDALAAEQVWLDWSPCEYNIETRAKLCSSPSRSPRRSPSPETREKIASAQRGKPRKKHTVEFKQRLSERMRGRNLADSTKAKLSDALKGRKFSSEWRSKLSASAKKRKISDAGRTKLSASVKARGFTDTHRKQLDAARSLRRFSDEWKAKLCHPKRRKT